MPGRMRERALREPRRLGCTRWKTGGYENAEPWRFDRSPEAAVHRLGHGPRRLRRRSRCGRRSDRLSHTELRGRRRGLGDRRGPVRDGLRERALRTGIPTSRPGRRIAISRCSRNGSISSSARSWSRTSATTRSSTMRTESQADERPDPTMPVAGFDHVAIPTARPEEMLRFYRALGFAVPSAQEWAARRHAFLLDPVRRQQDQRACTDALEECRLHPAGDIRSAGLRRLLLRLVGLARRPAPHVARCRRADRGGASGAYRWARCRPSQRHEHLHARSGPESSGVHRVRGGRLTRLPGDAATRAPIASRVHGEEKACAVRSIAHDQEALRLERSLRFSPRLRPHRKCRASRWTRPGRSSCRTTGSWDRSAVSRWTRTTTSGCISAQAR